MLLLLSTDGSPTRRAPLSLDWLIVHDGAVDASLPLVTNAASSRDLGPLMASVASGDRGALSELYRRTSAKLYGICVRMLGSEAEAEDVLQEVYLIVWNKADRFDPGKASPITWLGVLARNKSIDRLRLRRLATGPLNRPMMSATILRPRSRCWRRRRSSAG